MSSPVDFLASPSVPLEKGWEKKMIAIFGLKCSEQSEKSNHAMSWGRMFVDSLVGRTDWSSKRCMLTWKVKDTKSKRLYFQLSASMPHTKGIESTLLLKTPAAMDAYSENLSKKEQVFGNSGTLAQEVATGFIYKRGIIPTPIAGDWKGQLRSDGTANMLSGKATLGLLPTPNSYDWNTATKPETYLARSQRHKENNVNLQMTLRQMTMFVPNKVDHPKLGTGSQLNPHFVAEMMGFPLNWTDLPFLSGEKNP
jgi:hypothetical protein